MITFDVEFQLSAVIAVPIVNRYEILEIILPALFPIPNNEINKIVVRANTLLDVAIVTGKCSVCFFIDLLEIRIKKTELILFGNSRGILIAFLIVFQRIKGDRRGFVTENL